MARIFVAALSVVTIVALGLVALQYRVDALDSAGLTGNDAEAFNLTVEVSSNTMTIAGNALPWLFALLVVVFLIVLLLVGSGR